MSDRHEVSANPSVRAKSAPSIRARVRAELTDEIKAVATRHLATDGANLSLRAVARDLGMVSSALYHYFPGRDDLLTTLIIDAYNALGSTVEAADAAVADRADFRGRWLACGHAVRTWAIGHPAEYALVFGSPVVGYAAPPDTIPPAIRTPTALVGILADAVASGAFAYAGSSEASERRVRTGTDRGRGPSAAVAAPRPLPADVVADLTRVRAEFFPTVPEPVLALGTIGWIHLFGAVSFELFGQLNNVIKAREGYFDHQLHLMADLIGL